MSMTVIRAHGVRLSLAAVAAFCVGCGAPDAPSGLESLDSATSGLRADGAVPAASLAAENGDLALLRRATARFHRAEEAAAAGYTVLVAHPESGHVCLTDPDEGGMGRHLLNPDLVADAEVRVDQPEVLVYEPQSNGRLRLVGVEYVIPYTELGPEASPPTLLGREFLHNPTFGLWMMHVYVWKHNPAGMFATWNPAVTCDHDGAVAP